MSRLEQAKALAFMVTRDSSGRHFTERYTSDELYDLESNGLIRIGRPVHHTGIPYSQGYWHVELTYDGRELLKEEFNKLL